VRRCPSRCIEVELRCLVVSAAAWPGEAVHPGTLRTSSGVVRCCLGSPEYLTSPPR
jgi:hypothetical protein